MSTTWDDNTRAQTMAGGWDQFEFPDGEAHVVPRNDYKPHDCFRLRCWCHPKRSTDGNDVVVHNSMDRREFVTRLH